MSDPLQEGIDFFNSGRFYEAHESWEDLWRETVGGARLYFQGLVQVAVGLHHLSAGNRRGGLRVLGRGLEKLEAYPGVFSGIDNRSLINDIQAQLASSEPIRPRIQRT